MRIETKKNIYQLLLVGLLAILLGAAAIVPLVLAQGEVPAAGTVNSIVTYTYYPTTAVSGTSTAYSSAPRQVSGHDVSIVKYYNAVDVFVTVDVATTTDVITVTPQFSPDQSDWMDATYTYLADSETSSTVAVVSDTTTITTSLVTSTTAESVVTTTNTFTTTHSATVATTPTEQTYQVVASGADTKDYLGVPVRGEYMRFKIEYSGTPVTVTVKATLRNN